LYATWKEEGEHNVNEARIPPSSFGFPLLITIPPFLHTHQSPPYDSPDHAAHCHMVGIVTGLRTGWYGIRILAKARDFSVLRNVQPGSGTHPASH